MRTKPVRILTTLLAVMLCMAAFSVSALAVSDTTASTSDGTGTVISDTTNTDGKEFLTIKTSDNHVFYLIIDKQATGDNVYFLDTVTTEDLLSLVDSGSGNSSAATTTGTTTQTSDTAAGKDTSSGAAASSAAASSGATQTDEQNSISKTAAIAIFAAVILGVILLIVRLRKPKTPTKQEKDADDYDFLDDGETEEEPEISDEETEGDE